MSRGGDLDRELERLLGDAGRGVAAPRPEAPAPAVPAAAPQRPSITPADPAVQIVESAHQIVTMIGANPRAIRPILAQRRLTKEAVLNAAGSVAERASVAFAESDTALAERRAAHEAAAADLRAQIEAENAEAAQVTAQEDAILAECDAVRERIARVQARFGITALPQAVPEPPEEERHGLFGRLLDELTDNRLVGAFVRVRRGDAAAETPSPGRPDGRILRPDEPALISLQNMDEFVQATDAATPPAELYKTWCELSGTADAEVRTMLAAAHDLVARQVTQSTEVKRHNDEAHQAELARLQRQLDTTTAASAKAQSEQEAHRAYLAGLRDRAAKITEIYQSL